MTNTNRIKSSREKRAHISRYKFDSMVARKRPPRGYIPTLFEKALTTIGSNPNKALKKPWEQIFKKMDSTEKEGLQHLIIESIIEQDSMAEALIPDEFLGEDLVSLDLSSAKLTQIIVDQIKRCKSLKTLIFNDIFDLTDDLIIEILSNSKGAAHLEYVYLESCRRLTDETFEALIKYCPKLKGFDIGGCYNFTTENLIKFISTHDNRRNFTQIHVSGSANVTDRLLRIITQNCPDIAGLSIGYGKELSDAPLISLIQKSVKLETLQIHWNHKLSDEILTCLTINCPILQELNFIGCLGFSEIDILNFLTNRCFRPRDETPGRTLKRIYAGFGNLTKTTLQKALQDGRISNVVDIKLK